MEKEVRTRKNVSTSIKPKKRKKPPSIKKRKARLFMIYSLLFLLIVSVGVFVSFTVLFKIDNIQVVGSTRYDTNDIIKSSGIERSNNLFLTNVKDSEKIIESKFPYIGEVKITRKIPSDIIISVEECEPKFQVQNSDGYLLINYKNKIVDMVKDPIENLCLIKAGSVNSPKLGEKIDLSQKDIEYILATLISTVQKYEIDKITIINLSNTMHIYLVYENRIKIEIGSPENIDYKIKTASSIIKNELSDGQKGTLDVTLCADNNKTYFNSEYIL